MRRLAIAWGIGAILGVGVGFLLWSGSGVTSREAVTTEPEKREANDAKRATPSPDGSRTPRAIETTPIPEALAASLLKGVPQLEPRRGDGIVHGSVKTLDGVGIAGARITAVPTEVPRTVQPPEGDESDHAYLTRMAVARVWNVESTRRAETRDDGSYAVEGLGNGYYRLSGRAEGFELDICEIAFRVLAGATVDFVAHPLVELGVDVRYADGRRPESATIQIASEIGVVGRGRAEALRTVEWTPATTELRIRTGKVKLSASVGSPPTATSSTVTVDKTAAGSPPVELLLVPSCSIAGKLRWPEDDPSSSATIALVEGRAGDDIQERFVQDQQKRVDARRPDGRFRFERLDPGLYTILAARGDLVQGVAKREVTLTEGVTSVELELPPLDRKLAVEVVVTDVEGRAVEGADFSMDCIHSPRTRTAKVPVLLADRGRYLLLPVLPEELVGQNVDPKSIRTYLTVRHADHGTTTVPLKLGVDRELAVAFAAAAELVVTVSGLAASPVSSLVSVTLVRREPVDPTMNRKLKSRRAGEEFSFPKTEAGRYEVVVEIDDSRRGIELLRQALDLPGGTTAVRAPLPVLYELGVRVQVPRTGVQLRIAKRVTATTIDTGTSRFAEPDPTGAVTFRNLPPGDYELKMGPATMEVSIPATQEVVFAASPGFALRVRVLDRSGALAAAGLEDGDLVHGIDGVEVRSVEDLRARLHGALAAGHGDIVFLVKRGGREVKLSFAKPMAANADFGGSLDPGW